MPGRRASALSFAAARVFGLFPNIASSAATDAALTDLAAALASVAVALHVCRTESKDVYGGASQIVSRIRMECNGNNLEALTEGDAPMTKK